MGAEYNEAMKTIIRKIVHVVAAVACLGAATAHAQSTRVSQAKWELGAFAFGVSQQAYPGSDQQVRGAIALPFFLYRGEILRADQDSVGLRAFKSPQFELDFGAGASLGAKSSNIDVRRGMPNLGTLLEFGPRLKWHLGDAPLGAKWRLELPVRGVFELKSGLQSRGASFEPELLWDQRNADGWNTTASVGAVFGSRTLNDHFYGVAPSYATAARPAFAARSGLIATRLGVNSWTALSRDWHVFVFARLDSVASAANAASPLVRQRTGTTVGMGLSWTWLRSDERAVE